MSGLVGRGSRSFKKKIVEQSLIPALGIKKIRFAHENGMSALAANATIQFSTFSAPPEMTALGFSNPSSTEITNLRMGEFRNNVIVESNLNGVLIDQLAYTITNSAITFINDYVVDANEIFVITVGSNPVTGNRIVDARPLRASGDVDFSGIGSAVVDFRTGQGFRVAGSTVNSAGADNQQIGNVQVFVDGVLQFRNAGNGDEDSMAATDQTGNYREIALNSTGTIITGVDYANAIRFNMGQPFSSTEGVLVVATNLIVDEPNGTGPFSLIENIQAQINENDTELARIPTPVGQTPADIIQVNAGGTAYELVTPSSSGGGNPIGTIIQSILTTAQINTQEAGTWQLCDGAATTAGSALLALGIANVPDAQGRFLAGAGQAGSETAKVLNASLADQNKAHTHTEQSYVDIGGSNAGVTGQATAQLRNLVSGPDTLSEGGDEARPLTYVVNMFIKIN